MKINEDIIADGINNSSLTNKSLNLICITPINCPIEI